MQKIAAALPLLPGCDAALQAQNIAYEIRPDGLYAADAQVSAANAVISSYTAADALAAAQQQQLALAAATRWDVITGGHTTAAGIPLATDAISITLITSLYNASQSGVSGPFNFKDRSGSWQSLSAAQVAALYQDISAWVQSVYNHENTLHQQIMAAGQTWQQVMLINAAAGFPANS